MLEKTDVIRPLVYEWIIAHGALGIAAHILLLLALAVALWQIVKTEPMTSGSGIPQIKGILLGYMSMNWLRVLVLKIIGGVLAIGAGMSLGREGPSVQIGASAGQGIGELTKRTRTETRLLITAGAGAGLAAAFNAPLAGVMFCLEELTKTFSPLVLMATVAATATATAVTHMVFGLTPVFHFDALPVMPIAYIVPLMLLGLFVGALGQTFNKGLFISLNLYQRSPLKSWQKPLVPLVAAAILGYVLPAVLGGGNKLVDTLVTTDFSVAWLIIIFVVKYLLTMVSFGSGVPGGIFLPMLVLGAVGGAIFAKALVFIGLIPADYAANFIVFGMAAYFASVVRSPITGSVLVMEMTGSFQHLMSLIAVSMAAYLAADLMRGMPVYDALLDRSLGIAKKIKAAVKRHRHLSVVEFIVGEGSDVDSHTVAEVKWPRGSLLVSVRRGDEELVPTGALALRAGDFLYVLIEDRDIAKLTAATEEKI
ncbi:MAG: ClC family H(+)/Cl(-) exchange transporter [Selenomonadaceae bacterium]